MRVREETAVISQQQPWNPKRNGTEPSELGGKCISNLEFYTRTVKREDGVE